MKQHYEIEYFKKGMWLSAGSVLNINSAYAFYNKLSHKNKRLVSVDDYGKIIKKQQ